MITNDDIFEIENLVKQGTGTFTSKATSNFIKGMYVGLIYLDRISESLEKIAENMSVSRDA